MRKKKPDFDLFIATPEHVDQIQELLFPHYFNESVYSGLTYDHHATRNMILAWLRDLAFVAIADGKVVGFVAAGLMRTFYKEPEMDIDMFYVLPDYRATGISRVLAKVIVEIADKFNVGAIYTSCLSGIDDSNDKLYQNLWKKYGFQKLGTVMLRSK